ncbi:MAG: phosphatidylethanolamine N-methyltransferase [Rhodocyclaceae bacterium]|nr:MAG: phosphatidylethanolamine N-methyltransferase [Rhodocyclaceae bacterium]TND00799.1 MAG: phosphatidylethanolamine N-methyltransferase [Rhodocyclaceae bacterium]
MSLKHSYTLVAPFYDAFLTAATRGARKRSLAALVDRPPHDVLLLGVGTGLDLPHLPAQHRYVGVDLTAAMLARARPRAAGLHFAPLRGDVQRLPFHDASFDVAVLHLILAVVPAPTLCLAEAVRVLKPGGTLLVFDKFLRRGEAGWKRVLNPLTRHVATRLDVVFEDVLESVGGLDVMANEAALASGWFRLIRLTKTTF